MQLLPAWVLKNRGCRRQVLVCGTVCILEFVYGMIQTWPSLAIARLLDGVAGFAVTRDDISIIFSMLTLGMFLMPIVFGFIFVKLGRKTNLLLSAAFYIVTWTLIIYASSPIWLMAANLSAGFGTGTMLIIGPIYVAEIADKRIRGALTSCCSMFRSLGGISMTTVGIFIPYFTLNKIAFSLAIINFLSILIIASESPYWHLMCNDKNKAEKSFEYYWSANSEAEESETSTAEALAKLKETVDAEMKSTSSYRELFRTPSNFRASIIVIGLSIFQAFSGVMVVLTYGSTTLPKYDGFWQPNPTMALVNTLNLVSNVVGMGLIDKWGRRPLSILSNFGDAIGTGIVALYFIMDEYTAMDTTNIKWLPYVGVLIFISFLGVGMMPLPHILVGELFPANVRYHASVVSVCCIAGSIAAQNFSYLHLCHFVGYSVVFLIFSLSSFAATVFSIFYVFETKNLSLAEIQARAISKLSINPFLTT